MPPTPQTVQLGGQNPNQQQYDPSKGPPVQNAASLHTPPPQLPGRLPQAALPMPLALSQIQPVVLDQQCQVPGGQLQAQVKLQGAGAVLAAVNPHPHLQMQLQIQQQQQQQLQQQVLQPGQAVSEMFPIFAMSRAFKKKPGALFIHSPPIYPGLGLVYVILC